MRTIGFAPAFAVGLAACAATATGALAESITEQDIIDALGRSSGNGGVTRGVTVEGGEDAVPSIDLKVNFEFNSAQLSNESILTLDTLGRALLSDALKEQTIEVIGHTDASGTDDYNDRLSERRAGAVVSYLVRNFDVNPNLISSRGMGERRLLDSDNPRSGINRRVEIRNITR